MSASQWGAFRSPDVLGKRLLPAVLYPDSQTALLFADIEGAGLPAGRYPAVLFLKLYTKTFQAIQMDVRLSMPMSG